MGQKKFWLSCCSRHFEVKTLRPDLKTLGPHRKSHGKYPEQTQQESVKRLCTKILPVKRPYLHNKSYQVRFCCTLEGQNSTKRFYKKRGKWGRNLRDIVINKIHSYKAFLYTSLLVLCRFSMNM